MFCGFQGNNTSSGDKTETKSRNSSVCVPEVYTGTLCKGTLQSYQNCQFPKNYSNAVIISSQEVTQDAREERVQTLLHGLQLLQPSVDCENVFQPFLCLYIFGLCDSSGELYLPSSGECRMVTEETCVLEFQTALRIVGPDVLPQCEDLPDAVMECTGIAFITYLAPYQFIQYVTTVEIKNNPRVFCMHCKKTMRVVFET